MRSTVIAASLSLIIAAGVGCSTLQPLSLLDDDFDDTTPPMVVEDGAFYRIKTGDTLWKLSQRYGISTKHIIAANDVRDPGRIKVGMRIFLPGIVLPPEQGTPSSADQQASPPSTQPAPAAASMTSKPVKSDESAKPTPQRRRRKKGFHDLCWPVASGKISSRFGTRWGRHHDGIDLNDAIGTPVRAAEKGLVILAKKKHAGYGNLIIISHENGYFTVYAHNKRNLVKKGQRVARCQKIAELGDTGRVTGPHLHFEVRQGKKPRNPLLFLEP